MLRPVEAAVTKMIVGTGAMIAGIGGAEPLVGPRWPPLRTSRDT
jgi:hypothetical protein